MGEGNAAIQSGGVANSDEWEQFRACFRENWVYKFGHSIGVWVIKKHFLYSHLAL
jgi:hypothetical protein